MLHLENWSIENAYGNFLFFTKCTLFGEKKIFLYGKKVLYWKNVLLKKTFFTEKKYICSFSKKTFFDHKKYIC